MNTMRNNIELPGKFLPFVENLSKKADSEDIIPFVGREDVLEAAMETLLRKLKNNLLLIGKPGVGKTALITEIARRINSGNLHHSLKEKTIFEVSMNRLFFSKQNPEQFSNELEELFEELNKIADKVVIFMDEMVIESFSGIEQDKDRLLFINLLRSYVSNMKLNIIAATTPDHYYKFISNDNFFSINFSPLFLREPAEDEVMAILEGVVENFSKYYSLKIGRSELNTVYLMSSRFMLHRAFPGKAVELLDMSCAKASVKGDKRLKKEHVYKSISEQSKLPEEIVRLDPVKQVNGLLEYLKKNVVNQSPAMEELVRVIKLSRIEIANGTKKAGSVVMFLGPPGVGKSYTAGKIAEYLFGGREKLRVIDLKEYRKSEDKQRFIKDGSGGPGSLVKELEMNPFSVIFFENIESAHTDVLQFLQKTIDQGEIIDKTGKKHCFLQNIFIFSLTRIGEKVFKNRIGFIKSSMESGELVVQSKIMSLLENVDEIVEFAPLDEEGIRKIISRELKDIEGEVEKAYNCDILFDKNISDILTHKSILSGGSAHKMNEFIEKEIKGKILSVLSEIRKTGGKYRVFFKENVVEIKRYYGKK